MVQLELLPLCFRVELCSGRYRIRPWGLVARGRVSPLSLLQDGNFPAVPRLVIQGPACSKQKAWVVPKFPELLGGQDNVSLHLAVLRFSEDVDELHGRRLGQGGLVNH